MVWLGLGTKKHTVRSCFGLGSVRPNTAGHYHEASSKIYSFVATDTAGNIHNDL